MKYLLISLLIAGASITPANANGTSKPIVMAQASQTDYRVSVLEEQIRSLNGTIEELNFRILELQEQMRRTQEDNNFRLQELEDKQGSLGEGGSEKIVQDEDGFISLEKSGPSEQAAASASSDGATAQPSTDQNPEKRTIDGVEIYQGESGRSDEVAGSLGSMQFDEQGNVVDTQIGKPLDLTARLNQPDLLPNNPDDLFLRGYDLIQSGRYADGQTALSEFSNRYPDHPRLAEARFWLGESYLGRGQYKQAAEVYLDAHKRWPSSKYGPQSLLKLGVSVAGMNQRELACATFAEVLQKYPNSSRAVRRSVAFEQRAAQCVTN